MDDAKLDKKKVETVKLLLSSLFARKQKYLIIDGNRKNRLIYANFPYERTIYYRSTPEDTICGVTINDEIVPILHEAFPAFGSIVAEIELQPFMSSLNKLLSNDKTKWPEFNIDKKTDKLSFTLPDVDENGKPVVVNIGRLLPPDALKYYEGIMDQFMSFDKNPFEIDVDIPDSLLKNPIIYTDLLIPSATPIRLRYPLQDGCSLVSFKEYLKKRELPMAYKALVQYRQNSQAAKVALKYCDDWLTCVSMLPGSIWFPFI